MKKKKHRPYKELGSDVSSELCCMIECHTTGPLQRLLDGIIAYKEHAAVSSEHQSLCLGFFFIAQSSSCSLLLELSPPSSARGRASQYIYCGI